MTEGRHWQTHPAVPTGRCPHAGGCAGGWRVAGARDAFERKSLFVWFVVEFAKNFLVNQSKTHTGAVDIVEPLFFGYTIFGGSNLKQVKTTIGNLLVDLGKLSFGSLILGSILRGGQNPFQILVLGAALTIILFVAGICIIFTNKEE